MVRRAFPGIASSVEITMIAVIIFVVSITLSSSSQELVGASGVEGLEGRSHATWRRLDCQVFCRKTGFNGYVGGCQCGFTLFTNKRDSFPFRRPPTNGWIEKLRRGSLGGSE